VKFKNPSKGLFITFEGIEGCGKSTQASLLAKRLKGAGYRVKLTREPGGTPLGNAIRRILLRSDRLNILPLSELMLYLVSRHQHVNQVIKKYLDNKYIVISDRFSDSSVAYQGYGRGIRRDLVSKLNFIATDGLIPDLTILLDCPVTTGMKRVLDNRMPDRIEKEDMAFHERVRRGFLTIAKKNKKRIVVINGSMNQEKIAEKIACILKKRFFLEI